MKKSAYRAILHIYLIFFLVFCAAFIVAACLFFSVVTVRKPDGSLVRSDWPKQMTQGFEKQIIFVDNKLQVRQSGLEQLQAEKIGLQVLDENGKEVYSFQKLDTISDSFTSADLLKLYEEGELSEGTISAFSGTKSYEGREYVYILYFPFKIAKSPLFLNGERFSSGKMVILPVIIIVLAGVLLLGGIYGLWTVRAVKKLMTSVSEIASRSYLPMEKGGLFADLYSSLDSLDAEIRESDRQRQLTEKTRKEWIANITHDLKTPLSPIKGYAELLQESDDWDKARGREFAGIMLKNAAYMEALIDDLKMTYQLENNMLPINRKEQDLARFLRELIVDILNTPEYEERSIELECGEGMVLFSFDSMLLTRAFRNLLINAFVHGNEDTSVCVTMSQTEEALDIKVSDDGKGMSEEQVEHLFDRYYRGTDTTKEPEGTGLGLAIVKNIVELHNGSITVCSTPKVGTIFHIQFSC